jgi:NAD(P)H-flavin reductase
MKKVYKEGIMSQYVNQLKEGQIIDIRGPKGKFSHLLQPGKIVVAI